MNVYLAKAYFTEDSSTVLGVFGSLDGAKSAIEDAFSRNSKLDYLVIETKMNDVNHYKKKAWEYSGQWVELN